jgi:2-dehydro-3-deoxyphosphogluconate aldolase/(4S)-4-hydroxy-2-oxoglutarate aldolase
MSTIATVPRPTVPPPIASGRVVAVGRGVSAADAPRIAEALVHGGVTALEITLNEPEREALAAISTLAAVATDLGLAAGAGTVLSIAAAERAIGAGASFLVTPHTDSALVRWCAERGVPVLPGGLSPTEILTAWEAGASAVKLFPAVAVGPAYIALLRGPFPDIPLVPTGGVTADTAGAWIAGGALAVGLGGWLIGDGEANGVRARARRVKEAVEAATR